MAYQFAAASSEYYEYADNAAVKSGSGSFSVMLRVYQDSNPGGEWHVFGKGNSSGGSYNGVRYVFSIDIGIPSIVFAIDDNTNKSDAVATSAFPLGEWRESQAFMMVGLLIGDIFLAP
jgi:hypothetical protein